MRLLAFGDLHVHNYPQFAKPTKYVGINSRALWGLKCLKRIRDIGWKLGVDGYLFLGDLFYERYKVEVPIVLRLADALGGLGNIVGIPGNHDLVAKVGELSTNSVRVISEMIGEDRFVVLDGKDGKEEHRVGDVSIVGVPWSVDIDQLLFSKKEKGMFRVALMHEVIDGCVTESDFRLDSKVGIGQVKDFMKRNKIDVVLNGHVHKPQTLAKNIFCVGSPMHNRASDAGKNNKVFFIDTETKQYKWIEVEGIPRFEVINVPIHKQIVYAYPQEDYYIVKVLHDSDLGRLDLLKGLNYKIVDCRLANRGNGFQKIDVKKIFDPKEAVETYAKEKGYGKKIVEKSFGFLEEIVHE